uniref:ribosomal protein S2 n=1 Tax=Ulva meridionalis TaxID=434723 RepID=UPI0021144517|nr:ribosomal protein S2 [Ulva meridionalis]UTA96497.1 ribosomal protein S2 [Ulva meridionalis]UTA96557.1 ribosomal protein S2 [Ulva meridionalis]UTA96614.1 ribosomal protein S2 [Ulva meridionalis]UTA96666.1 ribosomal protein S2 [Ulva meridionalis]UTA96719.1 ribosomal protein S2 [Ulva meridionalis]
MIYIINNNTTYNYSRYSTRPNHIYNALLKVKTIENITNSGMFENNQPYLFQTKQLLCWGPDLAFLNLRNTFSNIFKALQICWSAARNNKKIVFINGNDSIEADSILINTWLIQQCKRHNMPRKLNNISNVAAKYINHLTVSSKYSISALPNKALFNHFNTFLNSLKIKTTNVQSKKVQRFIKNSNALFNSTLTQLTKNYDTVQFKTGSKIQKAKKIEDYNQLQIKILKTQKILKMKNAIQLQVKEAQTLTQQIAGEITAPLVGFLTNTKTGFNTLQNQLNDEFYNHSESVNFNNISKSLFKSIINYDLPTKTKKVLTLSIQQDTNNNNYIIQGIQRIGKSNLKKAIHSQKYLPFSFYIRPVAQFDLLTSGQYKAKQSIIRQNIFGKVFAWRLKGQHLSSIFYSQFKIFDQRNKYKPRELTISNQNNIEAFKIMGQFILNKSSKTQVLFKNTKNFITFKSSRIDKVSLNFYRLAFLQKQRSNYKSHRINSKDNRLKLLSIFIRLKLKKNNHNSNILAKKANRNSINNFYINRFYLQRHPNPKGAFVGHSVKDARMYSNQNKYIIKPNLSSVISLFKNNYTLKAYKNQRVSKRVIPKLFRYHEKKRNYYGRLINSNQLNQYQMFAKSPFINNKLADILFFINPEKNQNLVNQANCLKIPTIGIVSGVPTSKLGRHSCNYYNLNDLVNYPILGNPSSSFFIYTLIGVFIKTLRSS